MFRWKSLALIYITLSWVTIIPSVKSNSTTDEKQMSPIELTALNNFGYKLTVQVLKDKNNTNVVLSPTGITGLLAMIMLGSVGRSYDEISDKLGFSQDVLLNRHHHEQFGHLLEELNVNDLYSKTIYADAIFVDDIHKLREVYRSYLSKVYKGESRNVDFKDSVTAKTVINEWVSNNTHGKIPEFFKETLPIDTQVVLLSALYFSGQWEMPFEPEYTRKLPFMTSSGEEVMVDQMFNMGKFKYARSSDDGFEIMAFPYNDTVTTLYALKPIFPNEKSIQELLESLDYTKINDAIDQMKKTVSVIRFPKMDLQSDDKLENTLKALGIQSIFSPSEANFALMIDTTSTNETEVDLIQRFNNGDNDEDGQLRNVINSLPNPGIHVDSVVHSVKITINEYGTEASAATGGVLARTAQQFYLNTPFFMFIKNEKTNLITFSAIILDPTN